MSKQNSRKNTSDKHTSNNDNSEQTLFQIKADLDKIQGWQCLQKNVERSEANDCTINVLHLLSIIPDRLYAESIALFKNITKSGTKNAEIIEYISKYMNVRGVKKNIIDKCEEVDVKSKSYETWLKNLSIYLKPNHATIFNMALSKPNPKTIGHTILAYMTDDKQLFFLDPQQEKILNVSDITDMFEKGKYNVLCLFFKHSKQEPLTDAPNPKKHKRVDTKHTIRKKSNFSSSISKKRQRHSSSKTSRSRKERSGTSIMDKLKKSLRLFLTRNKKKRRAIIQTKRRNYHIPQSDMQISKPSSPSDMQVSR
jgi:hypothetical protein